MLKKNIRKIQYDYELVYKLWYFFSNIYQLSIAQWHFKIIEIDNWFVTMISYTDNISVKWPADFERTLWWNQELRRHQPQEPGQVLWCGSPQSEQLLKS